MKTRHVALAALLLVALASCASQPPSIVPGAPGFFSGLLHGLGAPISLVIGIFSEVRMYAFPNGGGWYDLGFLLGLSAWGGGAAAAR